MDITAMEPLFNDVWKNQKCGNCKYQERAPRPDNKPIDLSEPKILICRHSPPQIVYAVAQRGNQPFPVPLGSMYPMIEDSFPACSHFSSNKIS